MNNLCFPTGNSPTFHQERKSNPSNLKLREEILECDKSPRVAFARKDIERGYINKGQYPKIKILKVDKQRSIPYFVF